jgi:hypothetical protein
MFVPMLILSGLSKQQPMIAVPMIDTGVAAQPVVRARQFVSQGIWL